MNLLAPMDDAEYKALRRRMSRVRASGQNKNEGGEVLSDGDESDTNYKDLIRFWKKHNVLYAKELMPSIKQNKAKKSPQTRGRRKSIELEDLDQTSNGGLSLPAHLAGFQRANSKSILEEEEDDAGSLEDLKSKKKPKPKRTMSDKTFALGSQVYSDTKVKPKSKVTSASPSKTPMRRVNSDKTKRVSDSKEKNGQK